MSHPRRAMQHFVRNGLEEGRIEKGKPSLGSAHTGGATWDLLTIISPRRFCRMSCASAATQRTHVFPLLNRKAVAAQDMAQLGQRGLGRHVKPSVSTLHARYPGMMPACVSTRPVW